MSNSILYTKDGKFKYTTWFIMYCHDEYEKCGGDSLSFSELLAIAKTTYCIKQKNGTLYE